MPPKNWERNEILIPDEVMAALRVQILTDVSAMVSSADESKMHQLSAGWYTQLGMDQHAQYILSLEENTPASASTSVGPLVGPKPKKGGKRKMNEFNVERIVEPETRGGRRGFWVEWEGYKPSWEAYRVEGRGQPGEPLVTWEPWDHVAKTQAMEAWLQERD